MSRLAAAFLLLALAPLAAAQANATATLKGSTLKVTGGEGADDLLVTNSLGKGLAPDGDGGPGLATVVLTPLNGTTVNGSTDPAVFDDVGVLKIKLEEDADAIEFDNFNFEGPLTLRGGEGADQVTFTASNLGACKLFGDENDDTFDVQASNLGVTKLVGSTGSLVMTADASTFESLSVVGGPGPDAMTWTATDVFQNLKVNLSFGDDQISFTDCEVNEDTSLKLSIGVNVFTDDNGSYGSNFTFTSGKDDDQVDFTDAQIGETGNFKLGPGVNMLTMTAATEPMQVGEQLLVKGGPQDDVITFTATGGQVQVGENLKLSLAAGVNTMNSTDGPAVGEDFSFTSGKGDDHVVTDGMTCFDFKAALASGNNEVAITDGTVNGDLKVTAGSGDDTVELLGTTTVQGEQKINLGGGTNQQP